MSILLWTTTEMEYKIKCYNRSLLLLRVVIKLTIKGLMPTHDSKSSGFTELLVWKLTFITIGTVIVFPA